MLLRATPAAHQHCPLYNPRHRSRVGLRAGLQLAERELDRNGGVVSCEGDGCAFNSMNRDTIFDVVYEATPAPLPLIGLLHLEAAEIIVPTLGFDIASISNGTARAWLLTRFSGLYSGPLRTAPPYVCQLSRLGPEWVCQGQYSQGRYQYERVNDERNEAVQ